MQGNISCENDRNASWAVVLIVIIRNNKYEKYAVFFQSLALCGNVLGLFFHYSVDQGRIFKAREHEGIFIHSFWSYWLLRGRSPLKSVKAVK